MSEIKAIDVKELRDITNIGMMECKKALTKAKGDKKKAIVILKEKGLEIAEKRLGKEAKEGIVFLEIRDNEKKGYLVKVCCETDFVAKNNEFNKIVKEIAQGYIEGGDPFLKGNALKDILNKGISKTGEKIIVSEAICLEQSNGFIASYLHSNKKVGVVVSIEVDQQAIKEEESKLKEFGKGIAMQIAAMSPIALREEEISDQKKQEQKEIFLKQMEQDQKPDHIKEKIVEGKLKKFFSENCLLEMSFVKNPKLTIKNLENSLSKELKTKISIRSYKRFEIK